MVYITLILLSTLLSTAGTLKYIANPFPFNTRKGPALFAHRKDNITISCELDNATVDVRLIRKFDGRPVEDFMQDRLEKSGQTFIIKDVKMNDQFRYICEASKTNGTPVRLEKGTLYVDEAACIEQPIIKSEKVKVFEKGDTFKIRCTAPGQGYTPVKNLFWARKNTSFLLSNEKVTSTTERDELIEGKYYDVEALTVVNATKEDSGLHICYRKLKNCDNDTRREASILLKYKAPFPPKVKKPTSTMLFPTLSSNFTVNCSSVASPVSTIYWKKDGLNVKTCSRRNWCLLSWKHKMKQTYSGNYTCEATNSEGKDTLTLEIIVSVKPKINPLHSSSDENILTCETSSGYPKPNLYWEKERKCSAQESCSVKWENFTSYVSVNTIDTNSGVKSVINFGEMEEYGKFRCVAINGAGVSTSELYLSKKDNKKKTEMMIGIFAGALVFLIALAIVCICYREKHLKKKYAPLMMPDPKFRLDPNRSLFEQSIELPYPPEWEFPKERLQFMNSLGSGAFGQVWLANAKGIYALAPRNHDTAAIRRRASLRFHKKVPHKILKCFVDDELVDESGFVAVKTLKAGSTDVEYKDLASEIKVLIHIGSHNNIVNLLGACTRGGNLCAIIEYCPYGNLVNFLRPRRDVYSCNWAKQCDNYDDDFCYLDVAFTALQIANGMQFLSEKKLIHRDLAARNVLVGNDYVMKVADFGLSRNIEDKDYYLKESSGMLPVKWMAPESIFSKIYTVKSDVWSFGILLWEICTMGGSPYPGISMEVFLDKLQQGYRMKQPVTSPEELYHLMLLCWRECPAERPWFNEIVNYLNDVIANKLHISDNLAAFERLQSTSSESDYLVPKSPIKKKKGSLDTLLALKSLTPKLGSPNNRKKSCDVILHFPPTTEKSENNNEESEKSNCEQRYVPLQRSTENMLSDDLQRSRENVLSDDSCVFSEHKESDSAG